jgi:uncharacterized protein (TIGR02996 family)
MSAPIPDEQAALLAAICAEPDEDTPRLVYADWLQEHGDEEQATFVREAVRLEWLSDSEDEKRQQIAKRLDGIEARNGRRWLDAIGIEGVEAVYDRGMVEGVFYHDIDAFLASASVLFSRVPVRELTVYGLGGYEPLPDPLHKLIAMPEFTRLRALHLSNGGLPIFSDSWERFITSPHLANLRELSVRSAGLTDGDMRVFDRCEHLANLEELGLSGNQLTAAGALTVVRSPRLANLRRLGLAYNDILEDRSWNSPWFQLRDELINRFDSTAALGSVV